MTGTNHGMTGAVIAVLVREPAIAVPLSYASHFACDAIPHFGVRDHPNQEDDELFSKKFNIILVTDFIVAVSLMMLLGKLFPESRLLIWTCMIAAAIPDLINVYYRLYLERIKKQPYELDPITKFHSWIQKSQTYKGAFVEIAWFMLMGLIILNQR
jgi:hypothetical protein